MPSYCMAKWLRKWRRGWLYVRSNTQKKKRTKSLMKHFEQQTSSTLYLVHPKSNSMFQSCERLKSDKVCCSEKQNKRKNKQTLLKKKKKKKKKAFMSGLPICHELWDIAFIFFSLLLLIFISHFSANEHFKLTKGSKLFLLFENSLLF